MERITRRLDRELSRMLKHTKQHLHPSPVRARALFICGAQRSGTNMLISVLNRSRNTRVYNEDHPRAFRNYRLRNLPHLKGMIEKAPCQWVVFKCIMDSQRAGELLDAFADSRCIWIYRDYRDVAESAERKWSDAQRHIIRNIALQGNEWNRWYTENMPNQRKDLIRRLYHEKMNESTAGALKWFTRNKIYFDLALNQQTHRVLLVSYDRLVTRPGEQFERIANFLDLPIPDTSYRHVHSSSVRKTLNSPIEQPVDAMCIELMKDFSRELEGGS